MPKKKENSARDQLGAIYSEPRSDHESLSCGEVLKSLCGAGGWSAIELTKAIKELEGSGDEETIKGWLNRNSLPSTRNRKALFSLIELKCSNGEASDAWVHAFSLAWQRQRATPNSTLSKKAITSKILRDPRLQRLPSLFGTEQSLPLADAYVELSISNAPRIISDPLLLDRNLTLGEKLDRRIEARYAVRRSPKDQLDDPHLKRSVILGPPGAGKSSLLRRVAVEIADGQWQRYRIPLLVEAREYWNFKKKDQKFGILEYAISHVFAPEDNFFAAKRAIYASKAELILLVDGLDEIVSDTNATEAVYAELKNFDSDVSWIVASRPTGLVSDLHEDRRFEMMELDEEAIENLIDTWCNSYEGTSTEKLKGEIFGRTAPREMARNPFLLTALCFLKSVEPDRPLPVSRIQTYEALLQRIAWQAQRREKSDDILSPTVIEALQEFAYSLYDREGGVRQIFGASDWSQFQAENPRFEMVDFRKQIEPARLLTSWSAEQPLFHFTHLSFQEHLVGRALARRGVKEAMARRFSPAWRQVFRFYGAFLKHEEREDEFRELVQSLHRERDYNSFSLITLAEVFADAGVTESTTQYINEELREELYSSVVSGHEAGPEALIDALAELAPVWLESRLIDDMKDLHFHHYDHSDEEGDPENWSFVAIGRGLNSPYDKLARVGSATSRQLIRDTFWGDDQKKALMSAYAYAVIASPSDRRRVIEASYQCEVSDEMCTRLFAFVQASLRPDFTAFIGRIAKSAQLGEPGHFREALNTLADIGGDEAMRILEELLHGEIENFTSDNEDSFHTVLSAVARAGGKSAIAIIEKVASHPSLTDWNDLIRTEKIMAAPYNDAEIRRFLRDERTIDETLSALAGATSLGRLPSRAIVTEIASILDEKRSDMQVHDLALIEGARVEHGEEPILCELLLKHTEDAISRYKTSNCSDERESLSTMTSLAFDALARASWKAAKPISKKILVEREPIAMVTMAIFLAGSLFQEEPDGDLIAALEEYVFEPESPFSEAATVALGQIDLERLFRLQSSDSALHAMEQISADNGIMIFDDFWTDKGGKIHKWKNPPKKILHAYSDDHPDIPAIFWHEMSRFGFVAEPVEPDNCVAFVIYEPKNGFVHDLEEQAIRLARANSSLKLFQVKANLDEAEARGLAKQIGFALDGIA